MSTCLFLSPFDIMVVQIPNFFCCLVDSVQFQISEIGFRKWTHTCTHTHTRARTHTHTHVRARRTNTHAHTHVHTHTIITPAHPYAHKHTHTLTLSLSLSLSLCPSPPTEEFCSRLVDRQNERAVVCDISDIILDQVRFVWIYNKMVWSWMPSIYFISFIVVFLDRKRVRRKRHLLDIFHHVRPETWTQKLVVPSALGLLSYTAHRISVIFQELF